jgi:hypothetical protein
VRRPGGRGARSRSWRPWPRGSPHPARSNDAVELNPHDCRGDRRDRGLPPRHRRPGPTVPPPAPARQHHDGGRAPLASPSSHQRRRNVFTTAILAFILAWNDFAFALSFLQTPDRYTAPLAIVNLGQSQYQVFYNRIDAAVVIVTIPIALLVIFAQRRIISGLTARSFR